MPTKVNVTTSATLVSAARQRQFIAIQNQSDTDIFIAWDATASTVTLDSGAAPGFKLPAGGSLILSTELRHPVLAFSNAIHAIHGGTGNKALSIQEI